MSTNTDVVVTIPIYRPRLDGLEQFSVDYSLLQLAGREIAFVAPVDLDVGYYRERYPQARIEGFESGYFRSVQDYSRLLLSPAFYRRFEPSKFLLILQPDAIVLRDDLDFWAGQPFDYIGAPWPDGYEFLINFDRFSGPLGHRIRVKVGNGGFSLRRIGKCLRLFDEFPDASATFLRTGSNEDLFFAVMGAVSNDFVLPNEITASRFAMELRPDYYRAVNGGHYPMGVHAWGSVNVSFWAPCLPPLARVLAQAPDGRA